MKRAIYFLMGAAVMYLFDKHNVARRMAPYVASVKSSLITKVSEWKEKVDAKTNVSEED